MGVGGRHYLGDLLILDPDAINWSSTEFVIKCHGRGTHWDSSTLWDVVLGGGEIVASYFDVQNATYCEWHVTLAQVGSTMTVSDGRLSDDFVITS